LDHERRAESALIKNVLIVREIIMRWEYKTEQIKLSSSGFFGTRVNMDGLDELLNKHGRTGWELVSFQTHRTVHGMAYTLVVFKKPVN